MTINDYVSYITKPDPNEKPLDNYINDGCGLTNIFRSIAVIGDSLASGEFETIKKGTNVKTYHDMYEYSWGQYIARSCGNTVYNFSRGGMTAKDYMRSFAVSMSFFDRAKACQAYIIALGVNDVINRNYDIGKLGDKWDGDTTVPAPDDKTSVAAYYCAIIEKYKEIQPDAKFFLVSMPRGTGSRPEDDEKRARFNELLYEIAAHYANCYVIDLFNYMPANAGDYRTAFYLGGHLNPVGYRFTAQVMMSYIDYIIRHNMEDFLQVPFIGKGIIS